MRSSVGLEVATLSVLLALGACGPSNGDDGDDDGTVCAPGTSVCEGEVSRTCRPDGSGYDETFCDPVLGIACGASGACEGDCAPGSLGDSYVGCDYWPTITGNIVSTTYQFAVAVSNASDVPAQVQIDGGALGAPLTFTVGRGSTTVQKLPWVPDLKLCNSADVALCRDPTQGALSVKGAYHLRSNQPVTVYQFNPLDYTLPGAPTNSYSNDASLLFPSNAWGKDYYVASYPVLTDESLVKFPDVPVYWPSLLAVTAHQDGTEVTLTTRASTRVSAGAPAFAAGVPQTVTLNAGDVLELATFDGTGDLTGSRVTTTKPVAVLGGHYCSYVPDLNFGYCDHLEESMFPIAALSQRYIVVAPAVTVGAQILEKEEMVRIVATEPGTTLTYDPPIAGAPTTIANPGDFVEVARNGTSFQITATAKVMVSQYMEGSTVAGNTGDPSMSLAVPVEQYRTQYLFHAPTNYQTNYVDIIAPSTATVSLDGAMVAGFRPIGGSGYSLARVTALARGPLADGNHSITGTAAFGIQVYGYGMDTSYWYPGGLDLNVIGRTAPPSPVAAPTTAHL